MTTQEEINLLCCNVILPFGVMSFNGFKLCNGACFNQLYKIPQNSNKLNILFIFYIKCYHKTFSYPLQCCWNGNNLLDATVQSFNVILPIQDISDIKVAH